MNKAEERTCELQGILKLSIQSRTKIKDLWDTINNTNLQITRVPEEGEREKREERLSK